MAEYALPCIRCDMPLKNVGLSDAANQPQEGTAFESRGHYGSTVHDPPVGDFTLEVNVCDECLKDHAETHVLATTDRRPILAPSRCWIGYERIHREPVPWKPGVDYTETDYTVEDVDDFEAITARRDRYGHYKVIWPQGIEFVRKVVHADVEEQYLEYLEGGDDG